MSEGLFILTTIFVAYVVYAVIGEQQAATAKTKTPTAKPEDKAEEEQAKPQVAAVAEKTLVTKPAEAKVATLSVTSTKTEPAKPKVAKAAAPKVEVKPVATKTATAKSTASKKTAAVGAKSAGLKNPKTGDVVTTYSNYRFTKRWIKEALVDEGLLEKVYANNELNAETEAKIKEAIGKLEALDKYKA